MVIFGCPHVCTIKVIFTSTIIMNFHDINQEADNTSWGVRRTFYRLGMKEIRDYVRACTICQKKKYEMHKSAGLLQPLPVPMNLGKFVDGLH